MKPPVKLLKDRTGYANPWIAAVLGTALLTGAVPMLMRSNKKKKDTKKLAKRVAFSIDKSLTPFMIMLDMREAKKYGYKRERTSASKVCQNCSRFYGGQCSLFDINVPNSGQNNVCDEWRS
jgi:hypothetical protein